MRRPFLFIFLSTLLISGTSWGAWGLYRGWMALQAKDPRYIVRVILVKPLSEDRLNPGIVAEWLNLSINKEVNLYAIDLKQAEKRIERESPVKRARVKRVPPSTLLVEVELRKPLALLGERTNTAIDEEGVSFPLIPHYTPKKLPRLYLGDPSHLPLAKELLLAYQERGDSLYALDVEKCEASSFGEREIVLHCGNTLIRLDPDLWQEGLNQWFKVKHLEAKIVDLRLPGLAVILPKRVSTKHPDRTL